MAEAFDLLALGLLGGFIVVFFVLSLNSRGPSNSAGSEG
jgi:hypothetical protein